MKGSPVRYFIIALLALLPALSWSQSEPSNALTESQNAQEAQQFEELLNQWLIEDQRSKSLVSQYDSANASCTRDLKILLKRLPSPDAPAPLTVKQREAFFSVWIDLSIFSKNSFAFINQYPIDMRESFNKSENLTRQMRQIYPLSWKDRKASFLQQHKYPKEPKVLSSLSAFSPCARDVSHAVNTFESFLRKL